MVFLALKFSIRTNYGLSVIVNRSLSRNSSTMFFSFLVTFEFSNREKWQATTFSTLFLSLISRLNSWNKSIYMSSWGIESPFLSKYVCVALSKKITTLKPIKYKPNFPKINTIAKNSFSMME